MVSFSCEACGDVLTKKKLDSHRNRCNGSFTCLDCMTNFQGTDYRSHTSCISEAQKYQGALYKGKGSKRKSVSIVEPNRIARQAYVEDAPDYEIDNAAVALVSAPPRAPSPPTPIDAEPVNVFDFLVTDDTPNASRISLGGSKEQMCMVDHAQPLFKSATPPRQEYDKEVDHHQNFDLNGYAYGSRPVPAQSYEYTTPAPKQITYHRIPNENKSTDKKRKRQVEELDLTLARRSSQELDEEMPDVDDAGVPVLHSGLTGGLNRLLSTNKFPPSPEYSNDSSGNPSPLSPVKRKRGISGITIEKRGRTANGTLVKVRKVRRSSDESRPRKHHRTHRAHTQRHDDRDHEHKRTVKAIEYHPRSNSPDANDGNQLVVYRSRAELFLSFVTKGPDSTTGYSINKALKRYHRERSELGVGLGKGEEEKELWKSLRLKRNDRGEIVVITDGA